MKEANKDIDFSHFNKIENLVKDLDKELDTMKCDMTEILKEIREVLFTKADDEAITGNLNISLLTLQNLKTKCS